MKKGLWVLFAIVGLCLVIGCENITNDAVDEAARVVTTALNVIRGTDGDDRLDGTFNADEIWGKKGNDTIYGAEGADVIYAGEGNDFIHGGSGNDTIYDCYNGYHSEDGSDRVYGNEGNDTLHITGEGDDAIYPGSGNDLVYIDKNDSEDTITFESGTDTVELSVNYYPKTWETTRLTVKYVGSQPAFGTKTIKITRNGYTPRMYLNHVHYDANNKTNFYVKTEGGKLLYTIDVKGYTSDARTHWLDIFVDF